MLSVFLLHSLPLELFPFYVRALNMVMCAKKFIISVLAINYNDDNYLFKLTV